MSDADKSDTLLEVLIDTVWTAHKLRTVGGQYGAVNASGGGSWGVVHTLMQHGPSTVPQIARMRPVARQHIQVLANELAEAGLVRFEDNPAHKRSKLLVVTDKGRRYYEDVKANMLKGLGDIADGLKPGELEAMAHGLRHIMDELDRRIADQDGSSTS